MVTEQLIDESEAKTKIQPATATYGDMSEEIKAFIKPLSSLKLTVTLFALGIFLVLVGTLAQTEKDIWEVMSQYFRCWFAWVEFRVFAPPAWFPSIEDRNAIGIPFPTGTIQGFWFPGGWIIGGLMTLNLLVAHMLRFKIRAKGSQLVLGSTVIVVGLALTFLVITTGSGMNGVLETAGSDWNFAWNAFVASLSLIAVASLFRAAMNLSKRNVEFWVLGAIGIIFAGITSWLLVSGDSVRIDPSGMRILWQLIKATGAGLILLTGCYMLFEKRAGIVLLHAGVLLLMVNEINVAAQHVETQMTLAEGQTSNYSDDTRTVELAVIDRSGKESDQEIVIPREKINKKDKFIADERLPFDIKIIEYMPNSELRPVKNDEKNPATKGIGLQMAADNQPPSTGTDSDVDYPAIYVDFLKKDGEESLGKYMLPAIYGLQNIHDKVSVGGKTYEVCLRFKRYYKSYSIKLNDVRKEDYAGTATPRDYSSQITLTDESKNVKRDVRIWMNNPLRFSGETFYQSGYQPAMPSRGIKEKTTLQIVTNEGWMIPYVSCMIVLVGMLAHFWISLMRFLTRWTENRHVPKQINPALQTNAEVGKNPLAGSPLNHLIGFGIPVLVAVTFGGYLVGKSKLPKSPEGAPNMQAFGQIPVLSEGRVKPMDTLARTTMRILCNRETFYDGEPVDFNTALSARLSGKSVEQPEKIDAIVWLADLICQKEAAVDHRVIRIDNDDVKNLLKLPQRKSHRYSWREVVLKERPDQLSQEEQSLSESERIEKGIMTPFNGDVLRDQSELAYEVEDVKRSVFQRKVIDTYNKITRIRTIQYAFEMPPVQSDGMEAFFGSLPRAFGFLAEVERLKAPLVIPGDEELDWKKAKGNWVNGPAIRFITDEMDNSDLAWRTFSRSSLTELLILVANQGAEDHESNRYHEAFVNIIATYSALDQDEDDEESEEEEAEKIEEFNQAVANYQKLLATTKPQTDVVKGEPVPLSPWKVQFEHRFNAFAPFFYSSWIYVVAFLLTAFGWLAAAGNKVNLSKILNRSAIMVITVTFLIHTLALVGRIYISGRPPVTNLYSSAIFIGWGMVLAAGIFEVIFRMGIGNAVAATAGFGTLQIAHGLAGDGDTLVVLQAVLDTQFWLATHVVIITLGYAATFLAGLFGVMMIMRKNVYSIVLIPLAAALLYQYVKVDSNAAILGYYSLGFFAAGAISAVLNRLKPIRLVKNEKSFDKAMTTMIYGTMCFALFFSFVGTVLGGLWADDSWGRFWGWDPKENGALIIVLWNALVLHARWDRQVGERGFALLAIAGNITTAWSWFGVNELGVGLHSYGFTDGVLRNLALFVLSQLALIIAGVFVREKLIASKEQVSSTSQTA